MLLHRELPYRKDSAHYFHPLAQQDWSIFIDSGAEQGSGRLDIVVASPLATIISRDGKTTVDDGAGVDVFEQDPLTILQEKLASYPFDIDPDFPFTGGAVGYFAYDLGRQYFSIATQAEDDLALPDMAIGIYGWALVTDHDKRRSYLVAQGSIPAVAKAWDSICDQFLVDIPAETAPVAVVAEGGIRSNFDARQYQIAFERIQRYLIDGDCYQVNLAQRFSTKFSGDTWQAYLQLRAISPAPYGAYLKLPFAQLLSNSPELFLKVESSTATTSPIKGTRPRLANPEADRLIKEELQYSAKDRAENIMIVDLLRNDFGKVCITGSVRVERLFDVESFATVHHLVSTVTGRLAADTRPTDLLRACFPGGSITGAPKKRAMEIIEELEPHRRGVYCGAIGYLGFDGRMDTNIAIRTLVIQDGNLHYWAGGGIVVDSRWEAEYRESFDKAEALFRLLKSKAPAVPGG